MKTVPGYMLVLMGVLVMSGCSGSGHEPAKKAPEPAEMVKGAVIEQIAAANLPEVIEVVGVVRSKTSAVISSRVPGMVSVLKVQEGDRVKKGQLLIQLEAGEQQATQAAADAGADEAKRALDEAQVRKRLADATHERYQKLFSQQAVSRQEYDVRQADRDGAVEAVARAEGRLRQTRESARAAGSIAGYTRITAPLSGVVTSRQVGLGSTVFPSQPLMTIEDEGNYQLELNIPESLGSKVKPGIEVQISLDALPGSFAARIAELVPASDSASHTFIARINLERTGIKSGMFGRGAIPLGSTVSGMLVPKKAIVERGALTSVWVVDKDHQARMRLIKAGKSSGERVEILSGLSDGERVIVSGAEKVREGSRVE